MQHIRLGANLMQDTVCGSAVVILEGFRGKSSNKAQLIDLIVETLFECGCSVRRMEDGIGVGIVLRTL